MQQIYIVDIGPGAGEHGGEVIAEGTAEKIMQDAGIYHRRISQWSDSVYQFRRSAGNRQDG